MNFVVDKDDFYTENVAFKYLETKYLVNFQRNVRRVQRIYRKFQKQRKTVSNLSSGLRGRH